MHDIIGMNYERMDEESLSTDSEIMADPEHIDTRSVERNTSSGENWDESVRS